MDIIKILSAVDHTVLTPTAVWDDIKKCCDDGMKYKTASVCIPPSFVKQASEYMMGRLPVCTVIGFPNGYMTLDTKLFETKDALQNGADEIDTVINLGDLKSGNTDKILSELSKLKDLCGDKILKVIIETCLLTEDEKITMCDIVSRSGADFIKTSTGFSTGGATFDDIALFKKHVAPHVKIKAAGGISSLEDAEKFMTLGADRLGTSRIIKLVKEGNKNADTHSSY